MRNHGARVELLRLRPHDHIGWVFSGPGAFAALARPFLAEGATLGERLVYVAADPAAEDMDRWAEALEPGTLSVASIAEVYGDSGVVDAEAQRATFAEVLAAALAEGYSGIRVAADNTPLVLDDERLAAWVQWETVADRFMSEHRVTGLCAFDSARVDVDTLRHLATLHPLSSAGSPVPQFRLFADDGALCLEGELDAFSIGEARLALRHLPAKTAVVVDLSSTKIVTRAVLAALRQLCETGITVTVRGATDVARRLADAVGMPAERFSWAEA